MFPEWCKMFPEWCKMFPEWCQMFPEDEVAKGVVFRTAFYRYAAPTLNPDIRKP
jgi:signal-transduction protein with cAMP-binding, CBS, and nucleotidyltransferase domain